MSPSPNQSPDQPPRRGLVNPQVTARPVDPDTMPANSPQQPKLPLKVSEPHWQQIASVVIVVAVIAAWIILTQLWGR